MRSGLYLCGAPEVGLINMICIEMSRRYGLPTMGSAVSTDAKASNLQAGAEGMMTGFASALAGADSILAYGLLDGAQAVSLAKTVLDADTVSAIRRFVRDDSIDASTALFDDIRDVGIGGHYLKARSTREFLHKGELWSPARSGSGRPSRRTPGARWSPTRRRGRASSSTPTWRRRSTTPCWPGSSR